MGAGRAARPSPNCHPCLWPPLKSLSYFSISVWACTMAASFNSLEKGHLILFAVFCQKSAITISRVFLSFRMQQLLESLPCHSHSPKSYTPHLPIAGVVITPWRRRRRGTNTELWTFSGGIGRRTRTVGSSALLPGGSSPGCSGGRRTGGARCAAKMGRSLLMTSQPVCAVRCRVQRAADSTWGRLSGLQKVMSQVMIHRAELCFDRLLVFLV